MECVENRIFYHIQREINGSREDLWNVGETYFIGQRNNRFFEYFNHAHINADLKDGNSILTALGHTTKIIRELIFEEVRKEFFPTKPSRLRCLWVIKADDQNSLNYWVKELGKNDKVLKLKLTGKTHTANQEYLNIRTSNLNVIRQNAFHYWAGTSGNNAEEQEILFEGFVVVEEEMKQD